MGDPVKLNKEQYATLNAIATGQPHTLYPMMRRWFLRERLMRTAGPTVPPAEVRHDKQPVREYAVTPEGKVAIAEYVGQVQKPRVGDLKMAFGKSSTPDRDLMPFFEKRSRR